MRLRAPGLQIGPSPAEPMRRTNPRRGRPQHARRRPPIRRWRAVLTGVILGPLLLSLWLAGGGNADAAFAVTTTVRPGDTLSAIANRYDTTVAALVADNGIANPNHILAGATLHIPGPAPAPPVTAPPPAASAPSPVLPVATTVVVRAGDTLSSLASRWHTTVAAFMSANKLANPNLVFAGARLVVPGPALPPGWGPGGPLPPTLLAHPERLGLRPAFLHAATTSGVAPSLLEALCWWESGWQPGATSPTGAIGLCQLEPSTVTYAQTVLLHNPSLDPRAGPDNIAMAAAYIHDLTTRAGGNLRMAVAGYYQGLSSVQTKGLLPSTQSYVTGIFNYASLFSQAG